MKDPELPIFARIVLQCTEKFPDVTWECEEKPVGKFGYVIKLVGSSNEIRVFERIEPDQSREKILSDAARCAEIIVDRIHRLSRNVA